MNTKKRKCTSTTSIVLAFWLFFPLGFVFLYLRLRDKYGKYYAITKELYWTGVVWGVLGLFYLISSISDSTFSFAYFITDVCIFLIPGFICYFFGNKRNKKLKIYKKYQNYISTRRKIKIDSISNNVGDDYELCLSTIEEMINNSIINGYIDGDELIIKEYDGDVSENSYKEAKVVKCKECGAKNTIVVGCSSECEYCGSPLN